MMMRKLTMGMSKSITITRRTEKKDGETKKLPNMMNKRRPDIEKKSRRLIVEKMRTHSLR